MRSAIVTLLFTPFFTLCAISASGQRAQRFMVGAHGDIIKSDNDGFFEKIQGGLEGSLYLSRKFAVAGGVEWWTGRGTIAVIGARFCPIDEAFFRVRGLLQEDLSLGGGFSKPLSDNIRIEAMADFYFRGPLAIRAGIACGLGRHP